MKYYKIIQDNTFIGVVNSNNFLQYQEERQIFIGATPETGDLIECNNKLYRSLWMKPINNNITKFFEFADVKEISKEEYVTFMKAIETNQVINDEDWQDITPTPIQPPAIDDGTMDFIRSSKLREMSYACRTTIEAGFDLDIHDEKQHFSLTTQDQLNLMSLGAMAQTQSLIPYHADGEQTTFYTSEEINEIVEAANSFKIYHTTYYNALKDYINSLETIEEISAITYGVEIPEEYKSNVLKILEE